MSTPSEQSALEKELGVAGDLSRGALWLIWQTVRLPVFAFLVILEPIVRFVLSAVALLGVLMAFFFELSGVAPHFPFWGMLGFSVGCGLLLIAYYALLRLFAR